MEELLKTLSFAKSKSFQETKSGFDYSLPLETVLIAAAHAL